jgi:pimeloyl-ACP methyl ester carboxylesterase
VSNNSVYFSHGKDSRPWSTKIRVCAEVAEAMGFNTFSPDYRGMDDPQQRIQHLLQSVIHTGGKRVLVGSSMGAYVSIAASAEVNPDGLFVVAPAVYLPLPGCNDVVPNSPIVEVVHGWRDAVVPPENALRFAREFSTTLHMFDGDHRLLEQLPEIKLLFQNFLLRVLKE